MNIITSIETHAQLITAISMVALFVVTGIYAWRTHVISKAAEKQAEEMRQQRLSASQPVVWPMIQGLSTNALEVVFENIGNGPALDVDIYLGRGEEPIIKDSEHRWYSYIVAGDNKKTTFFKPPVSSDSMGGFVMDLNLVAKLVGKYTLLIEWRDLHISGPFFQAKLPFTIEIDSNQKPLVKEGLVIIEPIYTKSKPI